MNFKWYKSIGSLNVRQLDILSPFIFPPKQEGRRKLVFSKLFSDPFTSELNAKRDVRKQEYRFLSL